MFNIVFGYYILYSINIKYWKICKIVGNRAKKMAVYMVFQKK